MVADERRRPLRVSEELAWAARKSRRREHASEASRVNPRLAFFYSITTRSVFPRPKVSGWYISSALAGGTTNTPGVVARAT